MNWKFVVVAAVVILFLDGIVLLPMRIRQQTLLLSLTASEQTAGCLVKISAVVSNASQDIVIYDNGPVMEVASLRDGSWQTNVTPGSFTGKTLLKPGQASSPIEPNGQIEPGAKAVRVGLSFMRLSWRRRLALRIPGNRLLRPIASGLLALDRSSRSRTEWSDSIVVAP